MQKGGLRGVWHQRIVLSPQAHVRRRERRAGQLAAGLDLQPPQLGFGLCYLYLRNVRGFQWNHKRVYRIYKELELNLRIKPRKQLVRDKPEALTVPESINQVWSMDFMHDQLENGRTFRLFNAIDDFNREAIGMDVDFSLPSERVIRELKQIIA